MQTGSALMQMENGLISLWKNVKMCKVARQQKIFVTLSIFGLLKWWRWGNWVKPLKKQFAAKIFL